jgi:AhpD family alkylhydroperoxidase
MPAPTTTDNADATYQDIQATLGFVPQFMRAIPRTYVASFWEGMKNFEMSPSTKLDLKTKELIGLAVASQIPCDYCIQFHTENARKNGATDQEIQEAVGMAAMTRSGSTLLNGLRVDKNQFRRDMSRMEQRPHQQATK